MKLSAFGNVFMIGLLFTTVTGTFIPLRFGYTLGRLQTIRTIVSVSIEQCHDACLARKSCLSIEFQRLHGLCILSSSDSSVVGSQFIRRPRFVYSEKSNWSQKYPSSECVDCSEKEACSTNGSSPSCNIVECEQPDVPSAQKLILGTKVSVGSRMLHQCKFITGRSETSVCMPDGQWSLQEFECPAVNFSGKRFKIICEGNSLWLHYDGYGDKYISSRYQASDEFVQFIYESQSDGSYKLQSYADSKYIYDGYQGGTTLLLSTIYDTDDDNMRYIVTMETTNLFRIQTKSTERYVRLDNDGFVSTRHDIKDEFSLFRLEEMPAIVF